MNTEQDNVGELWDKFTALAQAGEESFDEYKARVDEVYSLLAHAKDKPSAGQYAHRLLWKLSLRYRPAVLALRASGRLKDADKIDWGETVAFINNHERSEMRLTSGLDADLVAAAVRQAPARRGAGTGGGADDDRHATAFANGECFKCGQKGHIARFCSNKKMTRARAGEAVEAVDAKKAGSERASAAIVADSCSSDDDADFHRTW